MSEQKYKELKTRIVELEKLLKESRNIVNRLTESENHYRSFFENSSEGIWCFEGEPIQINLNEDEIINRIYSNAVMVECNDTMARMYGFEKREDILGTRLVNLLVPTDDRNIDYLKSFIQNGFRLVDGESHEPDAEGKVHVFLNNLMGVIKDGYLIRAWGTQRDITDRKQEEETLRESEEKYRLMSENTSDLITLSTFSLNPVFTYVSPSIKNFGFEPEELIGKPCFDFMHPDDKKKLFPLLKKYISAKVSNLLTAEVSEISENIELRAKDKSGNWHYMETTVNLVKDEILYISRDITERKRMEENLQFERAHLLSIFDSINEIIYVADPNTYEILYANKVLKDAFKKDLIGGICYKEFQGFNSPCEFCTNETILKNKGKPYRWEYHNQILNKDYVIVDRIIKWPDERNVRFEIAIDITDLKRAEAQRAIVLETLRESEEKYRTLVENAQDGVFLIQDGLIKLVNPAFASMLGYNVKELVDMDFQKLIAPEDIEMVTDRYRRRQAGEDVPSKYEFRMLHKDGKTRIDVFMSVGLVTLKGKISSLGTVHDITERKRSDEQIKVLTNQIEQFSKISADILTIESDRELFIKISSAIVEISDFSRVLFYTFKKDFPYRDILGYHGLDENTLKRMKNVGVPRKMLEKIFENGIPLGNQSCYVPYTIKDILDQKVVDYGKKKYAAGKGHWHSEDNLFVALKDNAGNLIGMISVDDSKSGLTPTDETVKPLEMFANHISQIIQRRKLVKELRRLKEFNENIVTSVPIGIITIDKEGTIVYKNPEMLEILGVGEGKPILGIGKKIQEMPDIIAAGVADKFQDLVSGKKFKDLVSPFTSVYGKEMILLMDGVPLFDSRGKFDGGVFLIQDITEKKKMEEQFVQSEKLRALGEMAGGVAHDFNNVLSAILGRAQLLKRGVKDAEIRHGLEVMEKAALDGASTVKRIQEFTRVRVDREFGTVNINRIVEDAIQFTRTRWKDEADEKGIKINIIRDLHEVSPVNGSSSELREVFTNLIFNSIDAIVGEGDIVLRTEEKDDFVQITVKDTGIGMDKETQLKIFDPFFTTKGVKGTGLGLSVSYGIVSRHNGEISIKSDPGEVTNVVIKLPVTKLVEEGKKGEVCIEEEKTKPIKMLVVDDESAARDLLYDMLIMENHEVFKAADGKEALEIFKREGDIKVVLTDLGMPGISGWELSEQIKKIDPKTVVVMITGWRFQIDSERMAKCGIDRAIVKPFQVEQVFKLVADCVKLRRQRENE